MRNREVAIAVMKAFFKIKAVKGCSPTVGHQSVGRKLQEYTEILSPIDDFWCGAFVFTWLAFGCWPAVLKSHTFPSRIQFVH